MKQAKTLDEDVERVYALAQLEAALARAAGEHRDNDADGIVPEVEDFIAAADREGAS